LFLRQVALFEEELALPSGIGPMEQDEAQIDPAVLEAFVEAMAGDSSMAFTRWPKTQPLGAELPRRVRGFASAFGAELPRRVRGLALVLGAGSGSAGGTGFPPAAWNACVISAEIRPRSLTV
jgi:hypothetical protein